MFEAVELCGLHFNVALVFPYATNIYPLSLQLIPLNYHARACARPLPGSLYKYIGDDPPAISPSLAWEVWALMQLFDKKIVTLGRFASRIVLQYNISFCANHGHGVSNLAKTLHTCLHRRSGARP